MKTPQRVRIIKKVRETGAVWRFFSLDRVANRYIGDKRAGYYFLEWWEPSKDTEAKRNRLQKPLCREPV